MILVALILFQGQSRTRRISHNLINTVRLTKDCDGAAVLSIDFGGVL
jgi:hypothetical protein